MSARSIATVSLSGSLDEKLRAVATAGFDAVEIFENDLLSFNGSPRDVGARLAELVRGSSDEALENVSHYATQPAAKRLEKNHPGLAARLWRSQGMRIVDAKKSKYYEAALSNFERARDCYRAAGLAAEWEQTVRRVFTLHNRKSRFINGFQALVAGAKRSEPPSFLARAKTRWREQQGRDVL